MVLRFKKSNVILYVMNPVILTLFGEEYATQPAKPVRKVPAKANAAVKAAPEKEAKSKSVSKKKIPLAASNILDGWTPEKQYYTIGEVADLYKVNTSHIRFWTKEFNLKVRTTRKGDRLYSPEHVYELRTIYHLVKERGFTLAGAKAKLKEEKRKSTEEMNMKRSLQKLKSQLMALRRQLD